MVQTLSQLFLHTLRKFPGKELMHFKHGGRYTTLSTEDFGERVMHLSLALQELGMRPGDRMALLAENGPDWIMADLANLSLGGVTVPIYTTLLPDQIRYIIEDSGAKIVACAGRKLWDKIQPLRDDLANVKHYISLQTATAPDSLDIAALLESGKRVAGTRPELFSDNAGRVRPQDLASLIYTSGTTGTPKGVMLTHANFVSNVREVSRLVDITAGDLGFSFLPLSHVFERTVTFGYLYRGCSIGYAENMETLADDMREIRPHVFACVPRLLEKIYARVMDSVLAGSMLKRRIFIWAVKTGKAFSRKQLKGDAVSAWLAFRKKVADRLVFSKIMARLGGRVRFCVSAAAPLAKDLAEFFHAVGLTVLEGYGLTETSPAVAINTHENLKFGTVGKPVTDVEVRIAPDGEILVRGPNVMQGYHNDPAATAEAIRDGWLHTGDIGFQDEEGYLTITDRKKDIIITSGGKNTAPQPTETMLRMSPYITNAVVVGDRRKFLSALIVPNFAKLKEYAGLNNIGFQGLRDLLKNSRVLKVIEGEVEKHTRGLARFEKIKKFVLLDREFELERGEITPTLKVKRNIIASRYRTLIDSLYAE